MQAGADPAPSQRPRVRPPAADWDSPAPGGEPGPAPGTAPRLRAGTGGSSLGQDSAEAALPTELLAPLVCVRVDQQRRKGRERQEASHLDISSR